MYFKVAKTTETGKKFAALYKEIKKVKKARNVILDELGVKKFTEPWRSAFGGLECLQFDQTPDLKIWKLDKRYPSGNIYSPKLNSKQGKALEKRFNELPIVSRRQLNMCIGYNTNWVTIGCAFNNKDFYGFEVKKDWNVEIPSDCIEITYTEYNTLFSDKKVK